MKKRLTPELYQEYKATFETLKKIGKNPTQIRDILQIGNGTAKYINGSKDFKEYCAMRDEVLAKSAYGREQAEKKIRREAVKAAKQIIDAQPKAKRKYSKRTKAIIEAPMNIERLVQAQFKDLRKYLETDYADKIVERVTEKVMVTPDATEVPTPHKNWWGGNKNS